MLKSSQFSSSTLPDVALVFQITQESVDSKLSEIKNGLLQRSRQWHIQPRVVLAIIG